MKIALLGICSDKNSSYTRGAAEAPPQIRAAFHSAHTNYWSENGVDLGEAELFYDAGDIHPDDSPDPSGHIRLAVDSLLRAGYSPFIFGGDHSLTFPVVQAVAKYFSGLTILHFDAHPDLYDEFEGSRSSHACPFARIMESGLAKRLVQVGIRTANAHQRQQAERFGVEMVEMRDFREGLVLDLKPPLYISFDLDARDPAFAPGVSHYEPGGLSTRQALGIIQCIPSAPVAVDLVEYNPRRDLNGITAIVAAKLFKEIASRMLLE
jgi:arginase